MQFKKSNDGRQLDHFLVAPSFYWLKMQCQYVHHFLQQDVQRILRNGLWFIEVIHTETFKLHLTYEFGEQSLWSENYYRVYFDFWY